MSKVKFLLQWADNSLILGHRLGEWCGHGPVLEQDIALTNIALDLIGEARNVYQYAAEIEGNGRNEDYYPYLRKENEFLKEQVAKIARIEAFLEQLEEGRSNSEMLEDMMPSYH